MQLFQLLPHISAVSPQLQPGWPCGQALSLLTHGPDTSLFITWLELANLLPRPWCRCGDCFCGIRRPVVEMETQVLTCGGVLVTLLQLCQPSPARHPDLEPIILRPGCGILICSLLYVNKESKEDEDKLVACWRVVIRLTPVEKSLRRFIGQVSPG